MFAGNLNVTEDDVVRCLLEEGVWINNDDVDTLEKDAEQRSSSSQQQQPSSAELRYLRETVFPTLVPALHDMLKELNDTIQKSASGCDEGNNAGSCCPFRSLAAGGEKAVGSETFGQAPTHTSHARRCDAYPSSEGADASPAKVVEAVLKLVENKGKTSSSSSSSPAPPFYGPTGRCHPVEYLAQLLMRNNYGPLLQGQGGSAGSSLDAYTSHPYVLIEQHAAKNNRPGYWY